MNPTRFKNLRKKFGFTQRELAQKLNKAESSIRMWELGKSKPVSDTLLKLADCFDVTVDYLLGHSDTHQR